MGGDVGGRCEPENGPGKLPDGNGRRARRLLPGAAFAAISVPSSDKLPSVIDTVIAAIRSGELDEHLAQASKAVPTKKKSRPEATERRLKLPSFPMPTSGAYSA